MSAEPDYLPADALAEEEPKYLRRQKPVEIRKRKFSRKTWPLYRRVLVGGIAALVVGVVLYEAVHYFLFSPGVMLERPDQIEVTGNRVVARDAVVEKFSADMGHSVVRVPLGERRKALETLPWVELAGVQRVLPNQIRVEITERTPVAFLRTASDLSLVDSHGVILERPAEGEFRFPVVSGIDESMPLESREQRMNSYVQFMKEIELTQPGADDHISEVDLSDASDVRATLTGLGSAQEQRIADSCTLWRFRFRQPVSFACREYRPVACRAPGRRFGGFAVRAAGGGESGSKIGGGNT